jgi:ubiquinone/menaquinone biosynthesis C-methylase UbiE
MRDIMSKYGGLIKRGRIHFASMFQKDGPSFFELIEQALVSTQRGYDMIAPKFDKTPFRTPDEICAAIAKVIGEEKSIDRGLDVCCGTGAAMIRLRALCKQEVVGLDFSDGMLEEAARRVAKADGDAKVTLVKGDAMAMPFDSEFDVATCVGAFGHIREEEEEAFIKGIAKALRPGGRFVFATAMEPPAAHPAFWIAKGFNAAMRVRNALLKPEFIMYYLTFLWPDVKAKLERAGFQVDARIGVLDKPFDRMIIVDARKK